MTNFRCDLRSDTLTKPTAAMFEAMRTAALGDDVFGEDPSIKELEAEVSQLLGKEAGIFVPSGVMANQIAINLHTRPGDTVICEEGAHVFYHETGAAPALSGVQFDCVSYASGYCWETIAPKIRSAESIDASPSTLITIENTHNRAGGRILDLDIIRAIGHGAKKHNIKLHCDGARLWNAAVALDLNEKNLVADCDSVAVCFSKGLGAPAGSMLCGSKEFITQARRVRKRWGGSMRQSGILGAAALYAVRHHRQRLHEDHRLAEQLARTLQALAPDRLLVRYPNPGTNMVFAKVSDVAGTLLQQKLAEQGIGCFHFGADWVRLVTHLDCPAETLDQTRAAFSQLLK